MRVEKTYIILYAMVGYRRLCPTKLATTLIKGRMKALPRSYSRTLSGTRKNLGSIRVFTWKDEPLLSLWRGTLWPWIRHLGCLKVGYGIPSAGAYVDANDGDKYRDHHRRISYAWENAH
jgi:hypothetical protein